MKIGFVGCGNMAKAMVAGIIAGGVVRPEDIFASTAHAASAAKVAEQLGINASTDNLDVVQAADIVFLTVKPQVYAGAIAQMKDTLRDEQIVVTVAPGKSTDWICDQFGRPVKVVRTAPNTPALVNCAVTSYCANGLVTESELSQVVTLLQAFGTAEALPEHLLDPACVVGACSPAFVYQFIEAMADGGVAEGLPRKEALRIAAQAVMGSAKMVLETGLHPGELKDQVTSPGGTTIKGVEVLEKGALRGTVIDAIRTATAAGRKM